MNLYLNLGCGKAQFPIERDHPMVSHLKAWLPDAAYVDTADGARWLNVDRIGLDGVDAVVDLFSYPWVTSGHVRLAEPNSVEGIWCSHLIEHIPHDPRYHPFAYHDRPLLEAGRVDGWYAFFLEAWRALKPDGLLYLVFPHGWSDGGLSDPSHRRYLSAASFGYFAPNADAPFDYQVPVRFEQHGPVLINIPVFLLEAELLPLDDAPALDNWMRTHTNAVADMFLCLRAVKEGSDG